MRAFYYLNYIIFDFYRRKKDNAPLSASFLIPVLLIYLNVFSIIYWSSLLLKFSLPFSKVNAMIFLVILSGGSYFFLYHKNRYKEIFKQFDSIKTKAKYQKAVLYYIVISIIFFLMTLITADVRIDGKL